MDLTKKSIAESVQRFSYESYEIEGNICSFKLSESVFLGDAFSIKKLDLFLKKKDKTNLIYIGNYYEDSLVDENVILKIRFLRKPEGLPVKGSICLDYSENMINIDRQLDALDNIERENHSCQYSLKEIVAGVSTPTTDQLYGKIRYFNTKLDSSQEAAVEKALHSESIAIIQGPLVQVKQM